MFKKIMGLVLASSLSIFAQQRVRDFAETVTIAGNKCKVFVTKENGNVVGFHWKSGPMSKLLHNQIPFTLNQDRDKKHIRLVIENGHIVGYDAAGNRAEKFEDIVSYSLEERDGLAILQEQAAQKTNSNKTIVNSLEMPSLKKRIFSKNMFFGIIAAGSVGYFMRYMFTQSAKRRQNDKK